MLLIHSECSHSNVFWLHESVMTIKYLPGAHKEPARRDFSGRFSVPAFELNLYLISEDCRRDRKQFTRARVETMLIHSFKSFFHSLEFNEEWES